MTQEATDTKVTYSGNCHCGRYRFTLESEPIDTVTSCTCRVCTKKGYLWRVLDDSTNFKVTRDDGYLKTYNSGVLEHRVGPASGWSAAVLTNLVLWLLRHRHIGNTHAGTPCKARVGEC